MKAKKLFSVALTLSLALSLLTSVAFASSFKDVNDDAWYAESVERWSGYGVVTGSDGLFRPNDTMNRAEAATVFGKLFALTDDSAKTAFVDVTSADWFYAAVNKGVNAGILNSAGVGDGVFNPKGTLTREQFFTMFARGLGLKEQEQSVGLAADGADWSKGYINALTNKGYVSGMDVDGDGKLEVNSTGEITRASVMKLLDQTITVYAAESDKTYTGTGKGVMLVTADNCTVTGDIDTLVIASSAPDSAAAKAKVQIEKANIGTLIITGKNVEVTLTDSTVKFADIVKYADMVDLVIANGSVIEELLVEAENANITNSGVINSVELNEDAKDAEIKAEQGSYIGAVATKAAGTTISGTGAVANVVTSGAAMKGTPTAAAVRTAGTNVTNVSSTGAVSTEKNNGSVPAASSENASAANQAASDASASVREAVTEAGGSSQSTSSGSSSSSGGSGSSGTTYQQRINNALKAMTLPKADDVDIAITDNEVSFTVKTAGTTINQLWNAIGDSLMELKKANGENINTVNSANVTLSDNTVLELTNKQIDMFKTADNKQGVVDSLKEFTVNDSQKIASSLAIYDAVKAADSHMNAVVDGINGSVKLTMKNSANESGTIILVFAPYAA